MSAPGRSRFAPLPSFSFTPHTAPQTPRAFHWPWPQVFSFLAVAFFVFSGEGTL